MLDVKVDILKNRLYITLGRIPRNKIETATGKIEKAVKKLTSGFTCITRIIEVRDIDPKDLDQVKKIQQLLSDYGMARAVRVGVDHGKQLLTFTGTDVDYEATSANTIEAAEQILDAWEAAQQPPDAANVTN